MVNAQVVPGEGYRKKQPLVWFGDYPGHGDTFHQVWLHHIPQPNPDNPGVGEAVRLIVMTGCERAIRYSQRVVQMSERWALKVGSPCLSCYAGIDLRSLKGEKADGDSS